MFVGVATPKACPIGTFSPAYRLQKESECLNCTGGEFCNETSMTKTAGKCDAGYYCPGRSTSRQEIICPEGNYCPIGTQKPQPCPEGTYSNGTKLTDSSECTPCTPGWYCDSTGHVTPKAQCDPGYYCPKGQNNSRPFPCPKGFHCPRGTSVPKLCDEGTMADRTTMAACTMCPERKYCVPAKGNQ